MTTTDSKATNPKDAVGVRKWRQFATVPTRVLWEVGVAMLEGALKYGRHNYRVAGVRASVYVDAAKGHLDQWCEGEDLDPDTGLSHITKAIASLVVLRDGMLEGNFQDDRPPKHQSLNTHREFLQERVDWLLDKYPDPVAPFTQKGTDSQWSATEILEMHKTHLDLTRRVKGIYEDRGLSYVGEFRGQALFLEGDAADAERAAQWLTPE